MCENVVVRMFAGAENLSSMFCQWCSPKDRNSGHECTSTVWINQACRLHRWPSKHLQPPHRLSRSCWTWTYVHRWRLRIYDLSRSLFSGLLCPWVVEVFVWMKWYFQGRELKQCDLLKRHPPLTTTQTSDIRALIIKHSTAGWISKTWFNHESFNRQGRNLLLPMSFLSSRATKFSFLHLAGAVSLFPFELHVLSEPFQMGLLYNHFRLIWSDSSTVM